MQIIDPESAVTALNREIADQQSADRYIDLSHRAILSHGQCAANVLERLDHNIEDLMTDDELEAQRAPFI